MMLPGFTAQASLRGRDTSNPYHRTVRELGTTALVVPARDCMDICFDFCEDVQPREQRFCLRECMISCKPGRV